MNVIIVSDCGILDNPILIEDDTTAQATFNVIAEQLLGSDVSEVDLYDDNCVHEVNRLLEYTGKEIKWFVGIEVNTYKNN
jgi:hypothetical protein